MVDRKNLIERVERRVSYRLTEDAETDKLMRKQAVDVFESLLEHIKSGGMLQYIGRYNSPYVRIDWFTEYEKKAKNPLRIVFGEKSQSRTDGMYTNELKGGPAIVLYILEDNSYKRSEDELRREISQNLRDVFDLVIHEYIHYLDDKRTDLGLDQIATYDSKEISSEEWRTYFSDPLEVNAYFQSAVAQVQELIGEPSLLDTLNKRNWNGNFRKFKDWVFGEFLPDQLLRAVSKQQEKRLINRLYGYWENYVQPKLS
jgi:hypothetical protein